MTSRSDQGAARTACGQLRTMTRPSAVSSMLSARRSLWARVSPVVGPGGGEFGKRVQVASGPWVQAVRVSCGGLGQLSCCQPLKDSACAFATDRASMGVGVSVYATASITDLFGMLSVRVTGGDPCGRPEVCATHRAAG